MSNLIERLENLNIDPDAEVTFIWRDNCDIMHYTDDWLEDALNETNVLNELAEAATTGIFYKNGNWVLDDLRKKNLLKDYERGEEDFTGYCADAIFETIWSHDWVEKEVTRYDHKRGNVDMSFRMKAPWHFVKGSDQYFTDNWSAVVGTLDSGTVLLTTHGDH